MLRMTDGFCKVQFKDKSRTFSRYTLNPDPAAMMFYDTMTDSEPQTASFGFFIPDTFQLMEPLKNPFLFIRMNARAVIYYRDPGFASV